MNDISMNDISMNDISMNDISMNDNMGTIIPFNDNIFENQANIDIDSCDNLSNNETDTIYPFCSDITTNSVDISINKIELGLTPEDDYSYEYRKQEKIFDSRRICKILNTNLNIVDAQDKSGLSLEDIVDAFLENYTDRNDK